MGAFSGSWRPLAIVVLIALLLSWGRMPIPWLALALAGGGAYLLYHGWQRWTGRGGGGRATYWRGRRIELDSPARADAGTLLSLAAGGGLMAVGLLMLMQRIM
jgi:hypothetical protein